MDAIIPLPDSKSQKILIGKVGGVGEDIISKLPDNLLLHILSFLPIEDVLRTSALSTRWKPLWTCISDIEFNEYLCKRSRKWGRRTRSSFLDSVERVLLLHDSFRIRKLSLHLYKNVGASRVNSWVSAAVSHKVEELDLSLQSDETHFVLPDSLFTSASLSSLKLSSSKMSISLEVPSLISFSNLKILSLVSVAFPRDQFADQLFSACPILEELSLGACNWKNNEKITISIPTLRKFELSCLDNKYDCVITINAENLLSLECKDCLRVEFLPCNLHSLISARISDCDEFSFDNENSAERAVNLFRAIYNVKSLTLSEATLELW